MGSGPSSPLSHSGCALATPSLLPKCSRPPPASGPLHRLFCLLTCSPHLYHWLLLITHVSAYMSPSQASSIPLPCTLEYIFLFYFLPGPVSCLFVYFPLPSMTRKVSSPRLEIWTALPITLTSGTRTLTGIQWGLNF